MMTRKHFEAVAEIIRLSAPLEPALHENESIWIDGAKDMLGRVASDLADLFAQENPRFDREKFLRACGVEQ